MSKQLDPKERAARIRHEHALIADAEVRGDIDGVATAKKNLAALEFVEEAAKVEEPKRAPKPRRTVAD